ncbi:hypothetical protein [Acinetobacter baumannii]|uniref:hypothetical protein n=1 Tax=Acinetobacter baumannii TaxID=470 RepID=UPI001126DE22|nr:hypothetical protein [Acinetobacter baumannii]EHU3344992.1 hypothetical protein [Acinetobacter baumannii]TPT81745.1 hypothetical protein FJU59_08875 [Acinetobacter baumannii]
MQVTFLTTDEVADLIELHESAGSLVVMQETANEVVYSLWDDGAGEQVLINTACGSYLVTRGA